MIIAQISDTHIALDTPDAEQRLQDFERTVADINALDPAPDAIVHTGDIVHNGRADEYAQAAAILAKAKSPVYVMVGNKDNRKALREVFSGCEYLARTGAFISYAVEEHPVRLIALDTLTTTSNKGDFCVERAASLIDLINIETTKPIAVFTHHPPFEVLVGPEPFNFETPEAMRRLRGALHECERVTAIISGHVHRAAFGHVGNIPATVMPSTATSLRWGAYPPDMKNRPIYHLHRFDPAWGFSTETRIAGMCSNLR